MYIHNMLNDIFVKWRKSREEHDDKNQDFRNLKNGSSKYQEFSKAQEFPQSRIKIYLRIFLISSKNQEK